MSSKQLRQHHLPFYHPVTVTVQAAGKQLEIDMSACPKHMPRILDSL